MSSSESLYKFGDLKRDWEKDALQLAWRTSDLMNDMYEQILYIDTNFVSLMVSRLQKFTLHKGMDKKYYQSSGGM